MDDVIAVLRLAVAVLPVPEQVLRVARAQRADEALAHAAHGAEGEGVDARRALAPHAQHEAVARQRHADEISPVPAVRRAASRWVDGADVGEADAKDPLVELRPRPRGHLHYGEIGHLC